MLLRCSSLDDIMGATKGKQPYGLSSTAQDTIRKMVYAECYNTPMLMDNKYMKKGRACEDAGIELFNEVYFKDLKKHVGRKSNGFITGEPDLLDDELVIDLKGSWSLDSFAKMRSNPTCYKWQLIGYMWLYKKTKACTVHYLVNTPKELCKWEVAIHDFDHIPPNDRLIVGNVLEWRDEYSDMIKAKHADCVKFREDLLNEFKGGRELP